MRIDLNQEQEDVLEQAGHLSTFLEGKPGSGKTTIGVAYLQRLIESGIPAASIMVLLPQRTLASAYYQAISSAGFPAGGAPTILTFGGLARRMLALFWPQIASTAGFSSPNLPPRFLTLETAQYYAARLVQPMLDERGYFQSITINRNRLYGQILDNLNKAALAGISHTEIGERLKQAWVGKPEQFRVYEEAQICINLYRDYCLRNNLLDFSLQMETFCQQLMPSLEFQGYFFEQTRFLIYDNIEEDPPIIHAQVSQWLEHLDNYLLIFDHHAGYRLFLGADPDSGYRLKEHCAYHHLINSSFIQPIEIIHLQESLSGAIRKESIAPSEETIHSCLNIVSQKYYPEMVDWIIEDVSRLLAQGTRPGDIAIISPFLSDSLRFEFSSRFEALDIPFHTHRPSRSLREEPATHCLLTLLKLMHPEWKIYPTHYEFRSMLMQAITGFDLVRAEILSKIVYRSKKPGDPLGSFDHIQPATQERITYAIGERYEILRTFVESQQMENELPLDIQLTILFGELLSLPGFGFYQNLDAANTTSRLIDSYTKFTAVYTEEAKEIPEPAAQAYIQMIQRGVLAAQFVEAWEPPDQDAIFLSPAHTYLMANRAVDYQYWIDIGSQGWWERLNQPLTHPYVISQSWPAGQKWTDMHEYESNQQAMQRLVEGLTFRCRKGITMCIIQINEQGMEQRSPLLHAVQTLIRAATQSRTRI